MVDWLLEMRVTPVRRIAASLGRTLSPPRDGGEGSIFGCPACGAPRRHPKRADKRGAVGLTKNGLGWRCFECDESGDAVEFVALDLGGKKFKSLDDGSRRSVRKFCDDFLGGQRLSSGVRGSAARQSNAALGAVPDSAPRYPPLQELAAFWASCSRVDSDDEVGTWLQTRPIDPVKVADLDLARAAPKAYSMQPAWLSYVAGGHQRSWLQQGLRLIVPLVDCRAQSRSLILRRCFEATDKWPPKSVGLSGYDRAGLAMACPFARTLLSAAAQAVRRTRFIPIVVAEGEMDFITIATEFSDACTDAPATIGGLAGSWSLLEHVPSGVCLVLQLHDDDAGARYANEVLRAIRPRLRARELELELPSYFAIDGERVVRR